MRGPVEQKRIESAYEKGFTDGVAEGYKMATGSLRGSPGAASSVSSIRSMDVSQIGSGVSGRMNSIADEEAPGSSFVACFREFSVIFPHFRSSFGQLQRYGRSQA